MSTVRRIFTVITIKKPIFVLFLQTKKALVKGFAYFYKGYFAVILFSRFGDVYPSHRQAVCRGKQSHKLVSLADIAARVAHHAYARQGWQALADIQCMRIGAASDYHILALILRSIALSILRVYTASHTVKKRDRIDVSHARHR